MPHVSMLAISGCSMSTIAGPIDAFSIANLWHRITASDPKNSTDIFSWDILTVDGQSVTGNGDILIQPTCSIHDIAHTDIILIPGFLSPMGLIGNLPDALNAWLHFWYGKDTIIGTTCTGTFLLAETGLLDGKRATTNWAFTHYFEKQYPAVRLKPDRILTIDQNLICSGATTSFMDLCLYLIEKYGSKELSSQCAKALLIESNRPSQAPFFIFNFQKNHSDTVILKVQDYMEHHFRTSVSIDFLAEKFGLSPRHFKRRFKKATGDTPLTYLQRLRIEEARLQLETTQASFEEITWKAGYENPNSFRKLFKKHIGMSPKAYRDRFKRASNR